MPGQIFRTQTTCRHKLRMESSYLSSLDHLARRRYLLKLQIDGEMFPDPYGIDEKEWVNEKGIEGPYGIDEKEWEWVD